MDLPNPPRDTSLRNIIDKLAEFVARNGPEFETITKAKQEGNPKFEFLYGGEYYNYYQYRVASEQAFLKQQASISQAPQQQQQPPPHQSQSLHNQPSGPSLMGGASNAGASMASMGGYHQPNMGISVQQQPQQQPQQPLWHGNSTSNVQTGSLQSQIDSINMQQNSLRDQIRQSEHNLTAQHGVLIQQQQKQIDEAINKAQNDVIHKQAEDYNVYLAEFDEILQPIIESCTKDSISTGKNWILQHTSDTAKCNVVLQYLLKKALVSGASFTQKLHLIYLVNDVLHHCVRKNANDLKSCLENVVIPMFCSAEILASEEQKAKLCKLLSLWESKAKFFDACVISKLRSPESSMQEYKTNLMNIHNNIISTYTQATKAALESYKQQHQIFIQHAAQQIAVLEQQKQSLEQQVLVQVQDSYNMPSAANMIPSLIDPQQLKSPNLNPGNMLGGMSQPSSANQLNSSLQMPNSNPPAPPQPPPLMSQKIPIPPELQSSYGSPGGSQSKNNQMPYNNNMSNGANSSTPFTSQLPASHPYAQLFTNANSNNSNSRFGSPPPAPSFQIPDLSKPPPGFSQGQQPPAQQQQQPQIPDVPEEDSTSPTAPYYELPAGLMVPLIRLEDYKYKPLDPVEVRLPPPAPQNERLSSAIVAFYSLPSHDRPRDIDGWEKLGLYEYYKVKNAARKQKEEEIQKGIRDKSRSPSPVQVELVKPKKINKRCYRSKSRSRSRSKSRSVSPPPPRIRSPVAERPRNSGRYSNSRRSPRRSPGRDRDRERSDRGDRGDRDRPRDRDRGDRDRDRSVSPPSFFGGNYPKSDEFIEETNKGHQMLMKMGWAGSGTGLGSKGQGIDSPISGGEVRDRKDMYKGVGINLNDPYENFRKNKGAAFIHRMRSRAEEKS